MCEDYSSPRVDCWGAVNSVYNISLFDPSSMVTVAKDKQKTGDAPKTPSKTSEQTSAKKTSELKIFKTRKEVKTLPADKPKPKPDTTATNATSNSSEKSKSSGSTNSDNRSRHRSPTKILKRLLAPKSADPKTSAAKVASPTKQLAVEAASSKPTNVRDVQPPPTVEEDPNEGKLKISSGNNSEQKTSQTVVMHRKIQQAECQIHVVPRKIRGSVENLNGPKLRNEFFYPQRSSVCATFTLDRPKKLAAIGQSPKSPGLVSQHQNSAFTSNTSLGGTLNSRSMSSHQLLSQLNLQQMPPSVSISSVTIQSSNLNQDYAHETKSTESTPTQSPITNSLPKFPANQDELADSTKPAVAEEATPAEQKIADPEEEMIESVNAKTASLADKLSRGFFDLTQGSQDRLAKWKSKLQQYGSQQRQRSVEKESNACRRMVSLDGSVPGTDVMVVDWKVDPTAKPRRNPPPPPPRPLHSSRSATNALSHNLSQKSSSLMNRSQQTSNSTSTLPHTLHKSASVREADVLPDKHKSALNSLPHTIAMEHRTLKQRDNNLTTGGRSPTDTSARAQHMRSLHELVQSIEGFQQSAADKSRSNTITLSNTRGVVSQDCVSLNDVELPPPAKIMPYSGIKPQDNGLIRPIAFRPLANSAGLNHAANRHSNSPDGMPSFYRPNLSSMEQHKQALKDHSRSIGNLNNLSTPRSRNPLQPSTSSTGQQLFGGKSIGSLPNADENAYDVVPEYINEPSTIHTDNNYSSIYPFHASQHSHRAHSQSAPKRQPNIFSGNAVNSSQFTNSSNSSAGSTTSPHTGLKKSISGSQQNIQGHSSAHITPSPSDSGILQDYESLIRDKENELTSVRQAMEQNEEVLIRVYQEKERQFKLQVDELKQKLHNTQQTESALRKQLRQSDDIRQQLQKSVQNLNDEKMEMQRKCVQIERELTQLRTRLDEHRCDSCRRVQPGQQTQTMYDNNLKPVPAPRFMNKEHDLRSEVDDLKNEVSMLREQLNRQVEFFADERKRWEQTHLTPCSNTLHLNNNLPNKPTHFSALNSFGQQRSLPEKRPTILSNNTDRLI